MNRDARRPWASVGTTSSGRELQLVIDAEALRWQDRAACGEIGTELFFTERGGDHHATSRARAICADCPVRAECLEYALEYEALPDTAARHGIFGGTSPGERDDIARSRKRDAA